MDLVNESGDNVNEFGISVDRPALRCHVAHRCHQEPIAIFIKIFFCEKRERVIMLCTKYALLMEMCVDVQLTIRSLASKDYPQLFS